MVAATKRSALERMQEYYSEPNRAKFAREFKAVVDGYQQKITAVAKDLDAWYHSALWLTVIKQDYSPVTSVISWAAQLNMLAASLQGRWQEWIRTNRPGMTGWKVRTVRHFCLSSANSLG
jgi:hypothetical protein